MIHTSELLLEIDVCKLLQELNKSDDEMKRQPNTS